MLNQRFNVSCCGHASANADDEFQRIAELRELVEHGRDAHAQMNAMWLLAASDLPTKHRLLQNVLENNGAPVGVRQAAALALGFMGGPAAEAILSANVLLRDPSVAVAVCRALARIGGETGLAELQKSISQLNERVTTAATFAIMLISHRVGSTTTIQASEPEYLPAPDQCSRRLRVTAADPGEAAFCLWSLSRATGLFGIEFAEAPMYRVQCGRCVYMVLNNREILSAGGLMRLAARREIPVAIAALGPLGRWSIHALLLSDPASTRGGITLRGFRTNGAPSFGGTATLKEGALQFELRSAKRPGAVAVELDGVLTQKEIRFRVARSAVMVQRRLRPALSVARPVDHRL